MYADRSSVIALLAEIELAWASSSPPERKHDPQVRSWFPIDCGDLPQPAGPGSTAASCGSTWAISRVTLHCSISFDDVFLDLDRNLFAHVAVTRQSFHSLSYFCSLAVPGSR